MREGVRVQIFLTTGHHYSGKIISEDEIFLIILDKFGERVSLNKKDIQVLRELSE
jgi:sRNA-binding regulator protein Hfq